MDVSLDDLWLLTVALEEGSLTAAARRLGIAQATMSRRVAALETAIGHVLVIRSRSGLELTEAGRRLRPHLEVLRRASDGLLAAAEGLEETPRGRVRLAVPPGLAVDVLIPLLPALRARLPQVQLSIVASAQLADLDGDEADLAVRFVRPTSGDLVSRRLGSARVSIQASPLYLATLPDRPSLSELAWITWPRSVDLPARRWLDATLPDAAIVLESDDFLVQRAAALAGTGAVLHGATPGLVEVDVAAMDFPRADVFVVVRRSLADVPRVRAVVDLMVQHAATIPSLRGD